MSHLLKTPLIRSWIALCALTFLTLLIGCDSSPKASAETTNTPAQSKSNPAPAANKALSEKDAPKDSAGKENPADKDTPKSAERKTTPVQEISKDLYPDLPVGLLKPEHRQTLVKVTQAQLCPCKGSTKSLHDCLQKKETRCELAMQATLDTMRNIHEGRNERDALDALGAYIVAAHKTYTFDLKNTPYMGDPKKAKVTIVEFADFECPFCNFARQLVKGAHKKFGDDVVIYFKQYPLPMHIHATPAAQAAIAAHRQGKFWPMYDLLFDNQKSLSEEKIVSLAKTLGINMEKFQKDWKSPEVAKIVEQDKKDGETAQVNSTPFFFINGKKYLGEKTPEALNEAIANAIKSAK